MLSKAVILSEHEAWIVHLILSYSVSKYDTPETRLTIQTIIEKLEEAFHAE